MEYVKVESSQIDSVGYLPDVPKPGIGVLGIRFKSKSGLTEYHYGKITPEMYREMMEDKSIGTYFGRVIKPFPDKYPFMKVETENPPQPPSTNGETSGRGSNAKPKSNENETQSSLPSETEVSNPSTSLAIIDKLDNSALFAAGGVTDAQLAAGREWYLAEAKKYDISTEAERTELKRFARPLQKLRTGIEARAKEFTGETKRKIAAIDTEKRRLVQIVGEIEDAVLAPLTAWEREEETRKIRLANIVKEIEAKCDFFSYHDIESLEAAIAEVEAFDLTTMQEYRLSAESAKEAVLRRLRPELERRKAAELMREELESLRAADAKRQEEARIAAAAQDLADKQTQERLDAAVEAAKVETRQEVIAELSTPVEQAPQAFVYPEIPAPVAQKFQGGISENHEQAYNREAVEALMGCALTRHEAMAVLTAIVEGRIPHITITY